MVSIFDQTTFKKGLSYLTNKDPDLNKVISEIKQGPPVFKRTKGFKGLVNLIVEQQLSVASAKAIFKRLEHKMTSFSPENFLKIRPTEFNEIGLSRQKISYCTELAKACVQSDINFEDIEKLNDKEAVNFLIKFKGIGEWTAQCYLLACLGRRDAWPGSDLGLQSAIQNVKRLDKRPNLLTTNEIADSWKPYRGVAALILWSTYDI